MDAPQVAICAPRFLPREQWAEAAKIAVDIEPSNQPQGAALPDPQGEGGDRLAVVIGKRWNKAKGVKLTVGFLDNPPSDLRARLISHMNAWNGSANVSFVETTSDPQVRIARADDGYWSYLGTDILSIAKDKPTMNLAGFTMSTIDSEFHRVVRHETGHTMGFPHEHMRQELIQRLDPDKVIKSFMASQGWSRQMVIDQILTPLEESSILGTPTADQDSIMCYQIDGSLTKDGNPIRGGLDIDPSDFTFAAAVYPKPKH